MAAKRLPMRQLREVLRLALSGLSLRQVRDATGVPRSTVADYASRAVAAGLKWPLPPELDDDVTLERLLFPPTPSPTRRTEPDWAEVCVELSKDGVTRQLLWEEYRRAVPDGYGYSQFCALFEAWLGKRRLSMRQVHVAGEKMFVDFSGGGLDIVDSSTGEVKFAKLFVAVLGASSYTYVEPVFDERLPTWLSCHVNAVEFFGGVANITVPDNLRSGVTKPDRYEPKLNPSYADWARHYETAVIPARVRKPKDKAKVERAVLMAERWILAVLRKRRFTSLTELSEAIDPLLERLNNKPMRGIGKSRRELFELLDRPALKPLPPTRYEFSEWAKARVNIDYHVVFGHAYYSVPYQLRGELVEVRATATCVELLHAGKRVASHTRASRSSVHMTQTGHMPQAHRAQVEWTPARVADWASKAGEHVAAMSQAIMKSRKEPQQGFRASLGLLRLGDKYTTERLDKVCAIALRKGIVGYGSVAAMLKNNRDLAEPADEPAALPWHANVRGPSAFH
jgi:transposase